MIGLYRGVTRTEVPGTSPWLHFLDETMMNHLSWRINNSMRSCQNATRLYTLALARLPLFLVMSHESEDVRSKIELR